MFFNAGLNLQNQPFCLFLQYHSLPSQFNTFNWSGKSRRRLGAFNTWGFVSSIEEGAQIMRQSRAVAGYVRHLSTGKDTPLACNISGQQSILF